jgi:hypothetical protein
LRDGLWSLSIVNEEHNHKVTEIIQHHIYAERLKSEDIVFHEMTDNMVLPRNILSTLKKRNHLNATIWV